MKRCIVKVFFFMTCMTSLVYGLSELCDPDLSIENQKTKIISEEAKALLVKIIHDKVSFIWPVKVCRCWLSSLYGYRKSGFHNGIDLAAAQGTPVYASADGIVEIAEKNNDKQSYGNMILLNHAAIGYKTRYAHLHSLKVSSGDTVKQGQKIGTVGATGHVVAKSSKTDPSHLHFEIYKGSKRINPLIALFAQDSDWVENQMV